ncbi:hypothetical protein ABZ078_36930 [Streptomyces sp. NPDC006385]|uniref:hypothetical protein n=1 Tax=Streptomyces sp. NPDC006385 TaxID=3156761 RepID=UPI0033BF7812
MKSYGDFISDITDDATLYDALCDAIPFDGPAELAAWFAGRGYQLTDKDAQTLLTNQEEVTGVGEQVHY